MAQPSSATRAKASRTARQQQRAQGQDLAARMHLRRRRFLRGAAIGGAIAAIALVVVLLMQLAPLLPPPTGASVGDRAPDFSLQTPDGTEVRLDSTLQQGPVLLEFFWTDCPHCQNMEPIINELHDSYGDRVSFISVAIDPRDDMAKVATYLQRYGDHWPHVLGSSSVRRDYVIDSYPTFLVLEADGTIAYRHSGELSKEALAQRIDPLLE